MNTRESRDRERAGPAEFCLTFKQHTRALYSLAMLLTGNGEKAEQCFASALKNCLDSTGVPRGWAYSWSRIEIIKAAIRLVRPTPTEVTVGRSKFEPWSAGGVHPQGRQVMGMNPFHRFVFVLSVLDSYSVRDCALLLQCALEEVRNARRRAVEYMASTITPTLAQPLPAFGKRLSA